MTGADAERGVVVEGVRHLYPGSRVPIALDALRVGAGGSVAVVGPSGCGKTTVLHLIAGIVAVQTGRVAIDGVAIDGMGERARRAFRRRRIGLVFQRFALIDALPAIENIVLPFRFSAAGRLSDDALDRARGLADRLGLTKQVLRRRPRRLSQGEQQRVAVCRALVTQPSVLLCDEPTASLDAARAGDTIELLHEHAHAEGAALIVATHDRAVLGRFDRVIEMAAGGPKAIVAQPLGNQPFGDPA